MAPAVPPNPPSEPRNGLTRRQLLASGSGLAIGVGASGVFAGCASPGSPIAPPAPPISLASETPFDPRGVPAPGSLPEANPPAAATPPSLVQLMANPEAAISSGDAWIAFCEALKPLARHVTGPESLGHQQIQTEGIRCLSRLVCLGLDRYLEHGDPRHSAFYDLQTATRKYLGDNPDQSYRGAAIEASGTYRIRGNAADAAGVEIGLYAGSFRSDEAGDGGGRRLVDSLDEESLAIEDDGTFEIFVRRVDPIEARDERRGRNELRLEADANALLIRTYFWDRDLRERHEMPSIERIDVEEPAPPVDAATVLKGFLATAMFVDGSLDWWTRFEGVKTEMNQLIVMPDDGTVQTPSLVRYLNGRIELDSDEAFVLEFDQGDDAPDYWSWVLQNVWGETPDWRDRPVVLNNRDVVSEPDGRIRIILAHTDPGVSNWMDMSGHRRVLLSLRWRGESALPEVSTRTAKLAEFRS